MHTHLALVFAALVLTSCTTSPDDSRYASAAFSFSQCSLPSLMDINQNKYRVAVADGVYRLTNVHPSFENSYDLFQDELHHVFVIRDKSGRTMFEDDFDGVPRYVACVDLDRDDALDVIVELAAFGNHGNGTESFEILLNKHGHFVHQRNAIAFQEICGQENKAGILTWYSAPRFCAVFVGEELDVTGSGTEEDTITVGNFRKVKEVWGHANGSMRMLSKSSVPTDQQSLTYITFR